MGRSTSGGYQVGQPELRLGYWQAGSYRSCTDVDLADAVAAVYETWNERMVLITSTL